MRRRRLALASLTAAIILGTLPMGGRPANAAPGAGETVAREVLVDLPAQAAGLLERDTGTPAGEATGSTGGPVLRFTSRAIDAGQLFDRVGARWIASDHQVGEGSIYAEVRASADGATWGGWQQLTHAHDLDDESGATFYAPPKPLGGVSRYAQYRLWLLTGDTSAVRRFGLTFLDVTGLNAGPVARLINDVRGAFDAMTQSYAAAAPAGMPRILSRKDWGADESRMRWTPQYKRPHTKAIVHHTVTGDGGTNVAAELRSIYYFHAVTRGWGDIGYHYLVDKNGAIWTGRQGGDHVEAGHAFGWNNGTMGVASIGDYSVNPPTSALQGAITSIISLKLKQYGVVPSGADPFTHQEQRSDGSWVDVTTSPQNIIGHRDANYRIGQSGGQTACPGNTIANMMEGLRRLTQTEYDNGYTSLFRLDPGLPRGTFPGSSLTVPVTVANRGTTTIPSGTVVSYQILTPSGVGVVPQGGKATLGAPLLPNGTTVVQVPFTGPPEGSYVVRWDLHTGGAWWNNLYTTPVRDQWLFSREWSVDWLSDTIPGALVAGEVRTVQATMLNDGGRVWNSAGTNPVRLASSWRSVATGNVFPGTQSALPHDVQPGQTATVTFQIAAPVYPTSYVLRLDLVKENEFSFGDRRIAPDETTVSVVLDAKATLGAGTVPPLSSGQTTTVPVTITNTGRGTFPTTSSTPVRLGYHWYDAQGRTLVYDGARTVLPADLPAGQSVTVNAEVTAPSVGGTLMLKWDLVQEGVAWLSTRGVATANQQVAVTGPAVTAPAVTAPPVTAPTVTGPVVRTYAATYQPQVASPAAAGSQSGVPIVLVNTGSFTWPAGGANPIRLAYHWWSLTTNRTVLWEGQRTLLPADVPPGGSVSLNASVLYPTTPGPYLLRWDVVEEGVSWFSGRGVLTGDQFVRVESTAQSFVYGSSMLPSTPGAMAGGATVTVPVRVQNLGQTTWDTTINLSYHWLDAGGRVLVWEGLRTSLAGIAPGALRDVGAQVTAPPAAGTYTLAWDVVREGHAWFSGEGVQMPRGAVSVAATAAAPPAAPAAAPAASPVTGSYGATYAPLLQSVAAAPGATVTVGVMLVNASSFAWQPGTINASYHLASSTSGATVVWDGVRTALAAPVAANALATVQVAVKAPATTGTYLVRLDLVHEGVAWFSDLGVPTGSVTLIVQ